jgi:aromatic amino acid aminotransferase I
MSPPAALDMDTNGIGAPKPLTVDGIAAVRAKSAPMPAGVAPATSSDMFKSPVSPQCLQLPIESGADLWI